jgi:hypothetical protein
MVRSILAVAAGFVTAVVLVMLVNWIAAFALGIPSGAPTRPYLAVNLLGSFLAGAAGGYVTGRLAPTAMWHHVFGLALVVLLLSLPGVLQPADGQPTWYPSFLAVIGPVSVAMGGMLSLHRAPRRA